MTGEVADKFAALGLGGLNVMIATPCFGGLVSQRYMMSTFALLQFGTEAGFPVSVELLGYDSLITRSRNALVAKFLDNPQATHLLFIDADIGFELEQVVRMLRHKDDVVAGMYPLKLIDWANGGLQRAVAGEPIEAAPLRYVGTPCDGAEREERDGFVTGVYAGTGFMMIRRAALLRMTEAYAHLRFKATHTLASPSLSPNQYALFDCMIEPETGVYLSEDYTFCRRWRDIGGKIWLDTQGQLTHIGPHEFRGQPNLRWPRPAAEQPYAVAAE